MKLTTFLLLATSLTAFAATEEQLNKKFTIHPGGKLVIDVDFGSIKVSTNASGEVAIDVWRKVTRKNKADEEAFLRENPVTFAQDGDTITIRAHHKSQNGWHWWSGFRNRNEAKYVITVPAKFNARLKTDGGGISTSDLTGSVNADTSGGGLDFERLRGPLDGDTSGGAIRVTDCEGAINIHTSGGGIEATGGSGTLHGDTSGGGITVKDFHGPARIETSGGGLVIDNVAGAIDGSTSGGSIEANLLSPISGVRLETSGGGVTVRIPASAAFDLDAETSGGGVHSDLPVTIVGKTEHDRLRGAVNGGGKLVRLRSSGGGIHVERGEPQTAERP